jgi:hypothetical protein
MARRVVVVSLLLMAVACKPTAPQRPGDQQYKPRSQTDTQSTPQATTPTPQALPPPVVSTPPPDPTQERTVVPDPTQPAPPPPPANRSYGGGIGSNCSTASGGDGCLSPASVCLGEYPDGLCSAPCSRFCTDTASSKTFCINDRSGEGGVCVTKCTQNSDCRQGYTCQLRPRFNESVIQKNVCVPASEPTKSCVEELAAMFPDGVSELPAIVDGYETCNSSKQGCSVADPVSIPMTINGIVFSDAAGSTHMTVSCKMAQALVRFADFARTQHVTSVAIAKTYSCEGAADGATVSTHGTGDAIDFVSFTANAKTYAAADYTNQLVITDFWMVDFLKALQKNHVFSNIFTKECHATSDPADLFANTVHADLSNGDAPIRDWFTGGHWTLDTQDLQLTLTGTTYADQEVSVTPQACAMTTAQLCEPGH